MFIYLVSMVVPHSFTKRFGASEFICENPGFLRIRADNFAGYQLRTFLPIAFAYEMGTVLCFVVNNISSFYVALHSFYDSVRVHRNLLASKVRYIL